MISFVDQAPRIEPHSGGFILTFTSGDTETQMLLTLHAMSALCGIGTGKVKEAQATQFKAIPFRRREETNG